MSADWVLDNENKIYTIIKAKTYTQLKKSYPNIYYTTSDETITDENKFPTVYIHEMQGVERGQTLDGEEINAVLSTFEVRVTVNTKNTDAKAVMRKIIVAFKSLKFQSTMIPIMTTNANMYVMTARFQRLIGANDKI